jgi:CBS domain containing-hemolysin-like protein
MAMLILLAFSAFFSCSEAAFFSLDQSAQRSLAEGGTLGRLVCRLCEQSERLLSSILFGNLIVNLLIFTISSIITFQLSEKSNFAWFIALGTLLSVILFGEVLPKNFGIQAPRFFALCSAVPLSFLVRILQPVLPILAFINVLSRRLVCPNLLPESYLKVGDLERAVALSGDDASLLKREQRVLQNIVSLSDIQAEELMRPRSLLRIFKPPVTFDQVLTELNGTLPRSGYCLVTEGDSDEIASVLSFARLTPAALESDWENQFEETIYVPWVMSVAEVFERLQQANRQVAVVLNEFGETIGIITLDDIIETIFTRDRGRSRRLLNQMEIKLIGSERWQLTGLTSLRRLHRKFGVSFAEYSSITVGGLLREMLERFPHVGDTCRVGMLKFYVVAIGDENELIVHLTPAQ